MPKTICIIPARGGSKRIPRKNIKPFLGKPIISYSIETALRAKIFDKIFVSTDDNEIADIAKTYGASVPFLRSNKTSDDHASTIDVIHEVMDQLESIEEKFERICVLYPTAPFVTVERLKEGAELLNDSEAVVPITQFSFPVWRAFKMQKSHLRYQWPEHEKTRSQDLDELYHDAGQWYFIKTDSLKNTLIPEQTTAVELSRLEVQDIDTLEDWHLAEFKYEYLQSIK